MISKKGLSMPTRSSEYASRGDYHVELDPNWPYLPVYQEKMRWVKQYLDNRTAGEKILDAGCGEGVLVKEYRQRGLDIIGMDMHYGSEYVLTGSILDSCFPAEHFDALLCLDVIEHLTYADQEKAIAELHRVLRRGGTLLLSIPNLAHLASRLSFLLTGKLLRTSTPDRHPGDRPIAEYLEMLQPQFKMISRRGIFPTFPLISLLTVRSPARVVGLHRIYNRWLAYTNWCFLNLCLLEKR